MKSKLKFFTLASLLLVNVAIMNAQNLNTNFGDYAGNAGINNSAFGYKAGNVVTGDNNCFVGFNSGYFTTAGVGNTFSGYKSGYNNGEGSYNVFSGLRSGYYNNSGAHNVFIGYESGVNNYAGLYNVFVGDQSGNSSTGAGNTYIGRQSGYKNTYGVYNVCIGYKAGYQNTTGSNNIFIGNRAGDAETGSNRLYIANSQTTTPLIYGKFDSQQLGINTNSIPAGFAMAIKGKLITEEIKVQQYGTAGWPDFVFKPDYKLPSLKEVERHIKENGHLKDIPSAAEVTKNGFELGEMNAKLLQKIEELTLYTIEQEVRIKRLETLLLK